jgi:hypothetical protein
MRNQFLQNSGTVKLQILLHTVHGIRQLLVDPRYSIIATNSVAPEGCFEDCPQSTPTRTVVESYKKLDKLILRLRTDHSVDDCLQSLPADNAIPCERHDHVLNQIFNCILFLVDAIENSGDAQFVAQRGKVSEVEKSIVRLNEAVATGDTV